MSFSKFFIYFYFFIELTELSWCEMQAEGGQRKHWHSRSALSRWTDHIYTNTKISLSVCGRYKLFTSSMASSSSTLLFPFGNHFCSSFFLFIYLFTIHALLYHLRSSYQSQCDSFQTFENDLLFRSNTNPKVVTVTFAPLFGGRDENVETNRECSELSIPIQSSRANEA